MPLEPVRKVHLAVATRGHLLALVVTPAKARDRAPVAQGIRREVVRVPATLGGLPFLALAILVLHRFVALMADSA